MLRLRKIEWAPMILGAALGLAGNLCVQFRVFNALEAPASVPVTNLEGPLRWLAPVRIVTIGLVLFGLGCWFWRLNRWLREIEK